MKKILILLFISSFAFSQTGNRLSFKQLPNAAAALRTVITGTNGDMGFQTKVDFLHNTVKSNTLTLNYLTKSLGVDSIGNSNISVTNSLVSINTTTSVGIPNNTCDLNISHDVNGIDYLSMWNNFNNEGMLFIEENAIGFPMANKNGTLINAKIHLFSGGGYPIDLRMDNNEAQILFAGNKGHINSTGWLRLQGGNGIFDVSGYEGQDLRIGTDGNGTTGKGIYLKAFGNGNFRTGLKYLNNGASEPVLYLQPDAGFVNLPGLTASTIPYIDASKNIVSSTVTPTELNLLGGVTGTLATQAYVSANEYASVQCGFTTINLADGTTYYFATLNSAPLTASSPSRRFRFPFTGKIVAVYFIGGSGTVTSSQDCTLAISNVTSATTTTLGAVRFDNIVFQYDFTGLAISGSTSDQMEVQLTTPALAANGTNSLASMQIIFKKD